MARPLPIIVGFLLAVVGDTGCNKHPSPVTANSSEDDRNSSRPTRLSAIPLGPNKDGRLVLSLSDNGFTMNGSPVQVGSTTKDELEGLHGPLDRVADRDEFNQIGFWDEKGIRVYYSKRTKKIDYFDCIFVIDADALLPELDPRKPFEGVFKVETFEISKASRKEKLQGRVAGTVRDHSFNLPGFHIRYRTHSISFELKKGRTVLGEVRISQAGYR